MFDASQIPAWVSDGSVRKYHRAVKQLMTERANAKALGQPVNEITEGAVKELYVKWEGLVLGAEEVVEIEEEPKKKGKKAE